MVHRGVSVSERSREKSGRAERREILKFIPLPNLHTHLYQLFGIHDNQLLLSRLERQEPIGVGYLGENYMASAPRASLLARQGVRVAICHFPLELVSQSPNPFPLSNPRCFIPAFILEYASHIIRSGIQVIILLNPSAIVIMLSHPTLSLANALEQLTTYLPKPEFICRHPIHDRLRLGEKSRRMFL